MDEIARIRSFNREVTRRIGALETGYLGRGRPLGEARLMFEIGAGAGKASLAVLRSRLGLDSGYLSRLLRSLERQGLVAVEQDGGDGRHRRAGSPSWAVRNTTLTRTAPMRSPGPCWSCCSPASANALLAAMADVDRLLEAARIELGVEDPQSGDAKAALAAYFAELADRFDEGFEPALSLSADAPELTPPRGYFYLARLDGVPVGCVALKIKGSLGEIKRMWTAREMRVSASAGGCLLPCTTRPPAAVVARLRIETNASLVEAQALYLKEGFARGGPVQRRALRRPLVREAAETGEQFQERWKRLSVRNCGKQRPERSTDFKDTVIRLKKEAHRLGFGTPRLALRRCPYFIIRTILRVPGSTRTVLPSTTT